LVAIDIATPVSDLDPEVIMSLDAILVMSVPAGFSGQKFDDRVFEKIKKLNKKREEGNLKYKICVDGGVTTDNAEKLVEAGADELFIGKRLFEGDLKENIEGYRKVVS